jgi:hypothetical protein
MKEVFISSPHKSHSNGESIALYCAVHCSSVRSHYLVDGCSQRPPTLSGWTGGPLGPIWCRWPWQALLHRLRSALHVAQVVGKQETVSQAKSYSYSWTVTVSGTLLPPLQILPFLPLSFMSSSPLYALVSYLAGLGQRRSVPSLLQLILHKAVKGPEDLHHGCAHGFPLQTQERILHCEDMEAQY